MLETELQDYWTLVRAHRQGSPNALPALRLMSMKHNRPGRLAAQFISTIDRAEQQVGA